MSILTLNLLAFILETTDLQQHKGLHKLINPSTLTHAQSPAVVKDSRVKQDPSLRLRTDTCICHKVA